MRPTRRCRPAPGRTLLGGVDVTLLEPEVLRRLVAYLPQEVQLFRGTLRDNLDLAGTVPDELLVFAATLVASFSP